MPQSSAAVLTARLFSLLGGLAFAASLATGIVLDRRLAHEIARGESSGDLVWPIALNAAMFSAFALHHSLLARTGVKAWLTRRVSPALERTLYVWVASALFAATCLLWRPAPALVYEATGIWAWGFTAARVAGLWLTLESAARIDPRELAGVRQAWTFGMPERAGDAAGEERPPLVARGGYGFVRHPIYLGWMLLVWGAPVMSVSRLTFASVSTLYLLLAIPFEERSLRARFGAAYDAYVRAVRWRVLPGVY